MNTVRPHIEVGIGPLTFDQVIDVARHDATVSISAESLAEIGRSADRIRELAHQETPVYGVSTGFGALASKHVPLAQRTALQQGLIRSHAAGSGPEVEREVTRALMLLRLSTLATGRTGVRPEVAQAYAGMLSAGITPIVHEYGSLGCSGDLAPLAHCALAIIGEGQVRDANGTLMDAADALAAAGLHPIELTEKEGLALINGTDGMLGQLIMAITDLDKLTRLADIATAMSIEGMIGTDRVFAADLHDLRPHPGQGNSAYNIRTVLAGSNVLTHHSGEHSTYVQDAYSPRRAIDGLTAARGIDLRAPQTPAPATGAVITKLRETVAGPGTDRYLAPEINETVRLVHNGELLDAVEKITGKLR